MNPLIPFRSSPWNLTTPLADHATNKVNDRIIFNDNSKDPTAPERKQRLKEAFQRCINDTEGELTLYRWYSEMEIAEPVEEFVHVDSDEFSNDDDNQMVALDDDEDFEDRKPINESEPLVKDKPTAYGGTD